MQNQDTGIAFAHDGQDAEDVNNEASHFHTCQQRDYSRGGMVDVEVAMADVVEDVADEVDAPECHMQSTSKITVMKLTRIQIT